MKMLSCDVAVIGAGTAGLAASAAAAADGAQVLLIEGGEPGTTCARSGCMPSKLLIAAATAAHCAGTSSVFGIQTAPLRIDGRAVMTRVRAERDRFVRSVLQSYQRIPESQRLVGTAQFIAPGRLQVGDGVQVTAKAIVIATGAYSAVPAMFDAVADCVLTHETLFERVMLPGSVAVVGAGPLGLELGQALHRLGVRTAIFDRGDRIGGLISDDLNASAARIYAASLNLRLGVELQAEPLAAGLRLHWQGPQQRGSADFEHLLIAAGRRPKLQPLALHNAGIALDAHGVPVYDRATLRCGDSAVFIAGDCNHDRPLLHEAADEGTIAGRNAAACPSGVQAHPRRVPLAITFSDPQIAIVGDVGQPGHVAGRVDFTDQGRARVMNANRGGLKLYGDPADGRLAGAEMVGPAAEHLGHLLAWAVQQRQSVRSLLDMPFYHPTLEEGVRTALRDLCAQMPPSISSGYVQRVFGAGG